MSNPLCSLSCGGAPVRLAELSHSRLDHLATYRNMALLQKQALQRPAAFTSTRPASCKAVLTRCSAGSTRRDLLVATGGALLAAPALILPSKALAEAAPVRYQSVESLGSFQKNDQRAKFVARVTKVLQEALTAADAPKAMRLVLHDAGTYDAATKTGGFDGSIVLDEELNRPENASLKPLVERLAQAKKDIDAEGEKFGQEPISWADLLAFASKTAIRQQWRSIKLGRAATSSGGSTIADAFAADWPLRLGRRDSGVAAPAGRIPGPDAPVDEIRAWMAQLGAKPGAGAGPFTPKPPFWDRPFFVVWTLAQDDPEAAEERLAKYDPIFADFKLGYDRSRATVTRTDFEVDVVNFWTRLTNLGAKYNDLAYLTPEKVNIRIS